MEHVSVIERWTKDNRCFLKVGNGNWQEVKSPYAQSPVLAIRISDWSAIAYDFVDRETWRTNEEIKFLTSPSPHERNS